MIGYASVPVKAEAAAACGAANTGCGLWPIAFDQVQWQKLYANGAGCNKEFVVWNDENKPLTCSVNGTPSDNLCDCYQCDTTGDGKDDFAVLTGAGRAWLDYPAPTGGPFTDACSSNGCGASELSCHISNDSGAQVSLNQCIAGDSGVKAGVKNAIDSRVGDHVNISLYSGACTSTENCNGQAYHITSFGCVDVVGWVQNFELIPKLAGYSKQKGKGVKVKMNCNGDCVTACGGTDGTPAEPWQLKAVSLTK